MNGRAASRVTTLISCFALLVVGAFAIGTAPSDDAVVAPFVETGPIGSPVRTRPFTAVVTSVRIAHTITADYALPTESTTSEGAWVIADVVVTPATDSISLTYSVLRIGDHEYQVRSDLPFPSLFGFGYGPDVPVTGTLAFEVPASALRGTDARSAVIVLKTSLTPDLESVAEIGADLSGMSISAQEAINPARVEDSR